MVGTSPISFDQGTTDIILADTVMSSNPRAKLLSNELTIGFDIGNFWREYYGNPVEVQYDADTEITQN